MLASGNNLSLERRLEKMARTAGGNTFREVVEALLDKHRREERSEATLKKNRWLLEPAYAAFGDRPAGEVITRICCMLCGISNSADAPGGNYARRVPAKA
jgi:hypothetical protein